MRPDLLATSDPTPGSLGRHLSRPLHRQPAWRFRHHGRLEGWSSYRIRAAFKAWAADRGQEWPLDDIAVRTGIESITLSALHPAAAEWMLANMHATLEAVAFVCGCTLSVEPTLYEPAVRSGGRWLYEIPRLVVARSGRKADWAPWRAETLAAVEREALVEMIHAGLRREFDAWGIPYGALGKLFLIDEGRPMVISPAEGPHGLARLGVKFVAEGALDGDLFVGKLAPLGHGWIRRGGRLQERSVEPVEAASAKAPETAVETAVEHAPEADASVSAGRPQLTLKGI